MLRGVLTCGCLALLALAAVAPASAALPLRTAIVDGSFSGPHRERALDQTVRTGAAFIRTDLIWRGIAPHSRPGGFDPTDPGDPAYNWAPFDQAVIGAKRRGLEPILGIMWAPDWAEGAGAGPDGTVRVDPVEYGKFARAAARRYSGTFSPDPQYVEPLPRVRYWMAWNEPNRDYFFRPQYQGRTLVSAGLYRAMVNRFSDAVHAVDPTNLVVAGGLAPLGRPGKPGPIPFMRSFLSRSVRFDVWSHHPYTSGSPTHHAPTQNDVSLGDLPEMRAVLTQAVRARRVVSRNPVQFWVTEFSWDTKPSDPQGLPAALHARWTSEALYRMWKAGVSLVAWFRIQDDPLRETPYQSGFFTTRGRAKTSLTAFRFPTVAFAQRGGLVVWGRTPTSRAGTVVLEIKVGRSWRRLATVRAASTGIFQRTLRSPYRRGLVRARFGPERSLGFSLTPVADRYVNPFGCGGGIRC